MGLSELGTLGLKKGCAVRGYAHKRICAGTYAYIYDGRNISPHKFVRRVCVTHNNGPLRGLAPVFGHVGPFLAYCGAQGTNLDVQNTSTHRTHARKLLSAPACVCTGDGFSTCRHMHSRECTFGLQYALHFGTKLPDVPSNILGPWPIFGRKSGF